MSEVKYDVQGHEIKLRPDKVVVVSEWLYNTSNSPNNVAQSHAATVSWSITAGISVKFDDLTASLSVTYGESYTDTSTYTLSVDPGKVARIVYTPNIHHFDGWITTYKNIEVPGPPVPSGVPTPIQETVVDLDHVWCPVDYPLAGGRYELQYTSPEEYSRLTGIPISSQPSGGNQYTIQPGDTLHKIAQQFYGNEDLWQQIQAANPGINPDNLQVGQSITIPMGGNPPSSPPAPTPPSSGGQSYTIQPGDTLHKIAQQFYGNEDQWQRIQAANPGINPDNLQVGQSITIPG